MRTVQLAGSRVLRASFLTDEEGLPFRVRISTGWAADDYPDRHQRCVTFPLEVLPEVRQLLEELEDAAAGRGKPPDTVAVLGDKSPGG